MQSALMFRFDGKLGAQQASLGRVVNPTQLQAATSPALSNPVQLSNGLDRLLKGTGASLSICSLRTIIRQ
jgi:hypothetical protein